MAMIFAGAMIKEYRNSRKISAEKLSKGICDPSSLRRIEKGERSPSVFVLGKLMERLGFESNRFFLNFTTKAEFEFLNLYYEIEALIMSNRFDEAKSQITLLEHLETKLDNGKNAKRMRRQMILVLLCCISQGAGVDASERFTLIEEALELTIPDFDETKISGYMISYDEIALLNMLATTHGGLGNSEREVNILHSVKDAMDKFYIDEYEKSRGYTLTLYNLSSALGLAGRHEEVLDISNIAIEYCKKHKRLWLLPRITFNKACALFYLGSQEDWKALIIESYYALKSNGDYDDAQLRRDFAVNKLSMDFPD